MATKSELFSLANQLRKTGISQKEAFAKAKQQLANNTLSLGYKCIEAMKTGNVKFTFINIHGNKITTTGTLNFDKVPTNRKVEGSKHAKHNNMCVFYDVRHGVYRQFDINKVTDIISTHIKK